MSVAGAKDALQSMNLKFAVYDFATDTMSEPVAVTDDRFLNQNVRLFAEDDKVEMYFYKKDIDEVETAQQLISVKSNYTTWAVAEYDTVSEDFVKYGNEGDRKNWKFVEIKKPVNDPIVLDYASAVFKPDKKSSVSSNSWRMTLYTVDRGLNSEDEDKRSEGMSFADSEIWLSASKTGEEGQEFAAKLAEGDVTNARLNIMSDDVLITWLGESRTLYTISAHQLFATDDAGTTVFEHYCNNDTYESPTQDGGNETKKYEIEASEKQFAQDEDEIVALFQYQVVSGADGNDYLFTLAPGEEESTENGQELWGATYYRDDSSVNARSGWGELTQITHYKKIIDEMSLAVNENHQASILANIYDNKVDESGLTSGNYKLVELDCEPETSLEFRYEPYFAGENIYPIPGETARIDFTLENEGLLPAKNYRIDVKEIQKGQERQACEPIIYNADTAEIDETIFTGEERDFSVSVNLPESLDDLSYTVAVTETDGDGSKTYGTNKALLEVERSADLIEQGNTYILDGQRVEDIYNLVMLKYYSYGGRELTEDEMNQIVGTLDYQELSDLDDLFQLTGTNDLNELGRIDPVQKGIDTDVWYAITRFYNAGNADAVNVKATAIQLQDDDSPGETIGESSTIKNLASRDGAALVVPIDTKNGTLFNDLGVFDVSVEVTVNGESIGDDISLMAYTGENVGVCRDDGLDHFELNQGESIALDMVSHPFNEHAQLSYVSDNVDIAAVSEEGVVTALSEGECHVFVYDYSTENGMPFTKVKVSVTGTEKGDEDIKPVRVPVVQTLSENRLTFDSVEDGDTLYLLKGGKYTYEDGLMIIPSVKNAVKQKPQKLKLIVRKDSVLTLQKGDKTKTVTMRAMRVKKKRVTLNAQKNSAKLSVTQLALQCYGESVDPLGLTEGDSTYRYGKSAKASAADTGNPLLAAYELLNWRAPVFADQEKEEVFATAGHARDLRFIDVTSDMSIIKKLIMEYGSAAMLTRYSTKGLYACNEKGAKYTPVDENPNDLPADHAMTIVGWDDEYPKENFTYTPEADGAYLVKNSYGTTDGIRSGTGEYDSGGYCWISYEDCYFAREGRVFTFIGMDEIGRYDHNYGYDGSHNPAASLPGIQKAANVFIIGKDGGCEELRAVSFGTKDVGGCFDIEIFSLPMEGDAGCVWEGECVSAVRSFSAPYPGVYTADLSQPVTVNGREKFAVVITPVHKGENFTVITDQSDLDNGGFVFNSAARAGDGYVQIDGRIMDVTQAFADEEPEHASNVLRIRAYTKDMDRTYDDDEESWPGDKEEPVVASLKVPVSRPGDVYASSGDNLAPVSVFGSIKKLELDFDKVKASGVDPGALRMTVIAGTKLTVTGRLRDVNSVSKSGGIRIKTNRRTMRARVTCRYDGSATFIMEDGNTYTVGFKVQKPVPQRNARKIKAEGGKAVRTIKEMFATDIDGGKLSVSSKKYPAAAQVSGNAVIIDPVVKNDIRVDYKYLNKKYKLLIKVR